jgi:hypothetical protein
MKKLLLLIPVLIAATTFGGIYRHDVPARKYKELAAQKQFDCVGLIMDNSGQSAKGSCVLIGNKYVLSAAHCFKIDEIRVDTYHTDKNGKYTDTHVEGGSTMFVNQPVSSRPAKIEDFSFRFNGHRYEGARMIMHPAYMDSVNNHNLFCGDIVLIELKEAVTGVTPAVLNTAFDEKNTIITGVGYGVSGPGNNPQDIGPYMEKIAGQNVIDKLEGFEVDGKSSLLSSDFDAPDRNDCNRMGSAKPLPLEWSPGGGDSGGGLFRQVAGKWQLVGIITGGPGSGLNMEYYMKTKGYYGGISQNVRVSVYNKWIQQTIKEFEKTEMKLDASLK